jgi:hypothetical protein
MKRISAYLFLLLGLSMAWSCGEDDNMEPLGEWELSEPVLGAPVAGTTIILDENEPTETTRFEWNPAVATNRFVVAYRFVLVPAGSDDYSDPILQITPSNSGKDLFVQPTAAQIDYALWAACYPAGSDVNLKWAVIARAIETETVAAQNITFTRFETEYMPSELFITGSGTESGPDAENATAMRAKTNAEGDPAYVFEAYTTLTEGGTYQFRDQANLLSRAYGGADGTLEGCGPAITAPETGQYRVTVDLINNTYELLKIERWSLVGDAVEGGWGGDVPLAYKGDGVWESKIEFYEPYETAGFIFRANGNWSYLYKRIAGTATSDNNGGDLVMESEAGDIEFEDAPGPAPGVYTVTLDLSSAPYKYRLVKEVTGTPVAAIIGQTTNPNGDAVSGSFDFGSYDTPAELYLLSDGAVVATLTKDGDVYSSVTFLALQQSKTYTLNSASDGSGTTYNTIGDGTIAVARDQAYLLTVNFETGKLNWKYYNLKLFHWNDAGGWDARAEHLMTYSHPYTFEVTAALTGGFDSKFNSPWEVQFGTASTTLSGTMTNGGPNYKGIVQSGNYKATVEVSDDYTTATYSFVKQ